MALGLGHFLLGPTHSNPKCPKPILICSSDINLRVDVSFNGCSATSDNLFSLSTGTGEGRKQKMPSPKRESEGALPSKEDESSDNNNSNDYYDIYGPQVLFVLSFLCNFVFFELSLLFVIIESEIEPELYFLIP